MELATKAAKGVFWSLSHTLVIRVISFAIFVVLARLLIPEDFGVVALASVFIALVELLSEQGFSKAIVQRQDLNHEHCDTAFWLSLTLGLAFAGLLFVLAKPLALLNASPELESVLGALALAVPLRAASCVPTALLQRDFRFRALALRGLSANLIGGAAGIAAASQDFGAMSLVIQQLVVAFVDLIALFWAVSWRPRLKTSQTHLRELWNFSIPLLGGSLVDVVNRRAADFLIGSLLGMWSLGIYSVAFRMQQVLTQLLSKTGWTVAFPAFSQLQSDRAQLEKALIDSIRISGFVAFPIYIALIVHAPDIIELFFGATYAKSAPVLQILVGIGCVQAVTYFHDACYVSLGRTDIRFRVVLLHAFANLACILIAIQWGLQAVAAAYVIRAYLLLPIDYLIIRRLVGIALRPYLASIMPNLLIAMLSGAMMLALRLTLYWEPWPYLVPMSLLSGVVTYFAAQALFQRENLRQLVAHTRRALQLST